MTSPVAAQITPAGISAPTFEDIFNYLVSQYQGIFGADAYLGNDSQDGQLLAIFAQAISDCNYAAIAVYNAYSPAFAIGAGLSSQVKINGLKRLAGAFSSVTLTVTGVAGTVIINGQAQDTAGNLWDLPATVTIPQSGTINVVAVADSLGSITAPIGTVNVIANPQLGWQTVNNPTFAAVPGETMEPDAALRVRQSTSTALPSVAIFPGIVAALEQVTGVTRVTAYENNTNISDINGIPRNTLCFVVENGAQLDIASAIASKAPPGTATFGNISTPITDAAGVTRTINYQTPIEATVTASLNIHTLNGWASSTLALIQAAINSYLSTLPIGGVVNVAQVVTAATLLGTPQAGTFLIKSAQVNINGGAYQSTDIQLAFSTAAAPGTNVITLV